MIHAAAPVIVLTLSAGAIVLASVYFDRWRMTRPPVGVFNLWDVGFMLTCIVGVPFLYVGCPRWVAGALLGLGIVSALYFLWEPLAPRKPVTLAAALLPALLDLAVAPRGGAAAGWRFFAVNDAVIVLAVVAVANLWAQGGMKARHAALLGAALCVYDVIVTVLFGQTDQLFGATARLPLAPQVAWPTPAGGVMGIGMGDLLFASVFPLVLRKAFGAAAGRAALAVSIAVPAALILLAASGRVRHTFPVMAPLGPLMVAQFLFWRRRRGRERTTREYRGGRADDGPRPPPLRA